MRAAAILGPGCTQKDLNPFQAGVTIDDWRISLPAVADQADVILLFGGDGTIHRHLGQLIKLRLPVLIVPAGSGNDFARALGLRCVRNSLSAWRRFCAVHSSQQSEGQPAAKNNVRTIDLGVVTPLEAANPMGDVARNPPPGAVSYFCSVAGVGLDSAVARRAAGLPRWLRSHGGYALALAPTIFTFGPQPITISALGNSSNWTPRSNQPTLLAAFANTSTYGGGMKIAPRAQMDDGQLDVCVIGGIDPFKLACMFPTVYFGRHLRIRQVTYLRGVRWRVETETPLEIYADGEYVCKTPAEVSVAPGALRVISG